MAEEKKSSLPPEMPWQRTPLPKDTVPAMAYVPYQQYCQSELYDAEDALQRGTLFPVLDKPFTGGEWKP